MDYWNDSGVWFLIALTIFPRLTLLFSSIASGGLLWWLGWIFSPHLLVAILALPYWDSNPVLVVIAWMVAFGGTSGESKIVVRRRKRLKHSRNPS